APDAVVIGSGPNGLAAAVFLAQAGVSVLVLEAHAEIGGGTRTGELPLPRFRPDHCSAGHPMALLAPHPPPPPPAHPGRPRAPPPRTGRLAAPAPRWTRPPASAAHPLDDQPAVLLRQALADTAGDLGGDARAYQHLLAPFLGDPHGLLADALAPLGLPRHPFLMLRFGLRGLGSATRLARRFDSVRARPLLA